MLLLFRHSSLLLVAALAAIVTACSNDDSPADKTMRADGKVPVRLRLSVAGNDTDTRAPEEGWKDADATDDEMMNVWTVVAVHASDDRETPKRFSAGDIAFIYASIPENPKREIDDIPTVWLEPGDYDFYNFANIEPGVVTMNILGIPDTEALLTKVRPNGTLEESKTFPYGFFSNLGVGNYPGFPPHDVYSLTWGNTSDLKIKLHDYYSSDGETGDNGVAGKTLQVKGNGFDPTAADNGFQSKGIPMTNYQHFNITSQIECDLIVVRMLAKMTLQIQNSGSTPVTITTASLTDITDNNDDNTDANLMLLPKYTTAASANTMEAVHKDIQPNLVQNVTKGNYTHTVNKTIAAGATEEVTFYVNESVASTTGSQSASWINGSGLFYLTLGIKTGSGEEVVYTHALIDQRGSTTDDDNAWHYIARNDYRVIPVILTDWLFRVEPLAFVPIAGYPAVTLSSDAQKATFSTGGMIALQPFVKKRTEDNWRDFDDPEVEFVSIHWKNSDGDDQSDDGDDQSDDGKIIKTAFAYDPVTKCIIGELNNSLAAGLYKTAVTITVKLGPTDPAVGPQYTYSFTCDVILQKTT